MLIHVTVGHVLHGQDHVMQEIATLGHVLAGPAPHGLHHVMHGIATPGYVIHMALNVTDGLLLIKYVMHGDGSVHSINAQLLAGYAPHGQVNVMEMHVTQAIAIPGHAPHGILYAIKMFAPWQIAISIHAPHGILYVMEIALHAQPGVVMQFNVILKLAFNGIVQHGVLRIFHAIALQIKRSI